MGIKTKPCQGTTTESNEIKIKRKAKEIMNQLIWEGSHFENAAAICNHDGSNLTTNKSKIREAIKSIFGYIPKAEIYYWRKGLVHRFHIAHLYKCNDFS